MLTRWRRRTNDESARHTEGLDAGAARELLFDVQGQRVRLAAQIVYAADVVLRKLRAIGSQLRQRALPAHYVLYCTTRGAQR